MGTADVFLHRIFNREVTTSKYLYWKHFCGLSNPPKPKNLLKPSKLTEMILAKLI
jgi:hypothetical protein